MSTRADLEVAITKTPVLAALDRAGVPKCDDDGRPIGPALRIAVLACERDELRALLEEIEPFIGWLAEVPDLKRRARDVLEPGGGR